MSFDGQVDCQRMVMGPCALAIIGKPSVATPAAAPLAAARNLRRDVVATLLRETVCLSLPDMLAPPKSARARSAWGLVFVTPGEMMNYTAPAFIPGVRRTEDRPVGSRRRIIAMRSETSLCAAAFCADDEGGRIKQSPPAARAAPAPAFRHRRIRARRRPERRAR